MDLLINFLVILVIINMYAVTLLMVMRSVNKSIEKLRLSIKEDMRHLEESLNRLETNLSNHMKGIGDRLSQRVNEIK